MTHPRKKNLKISLLKKLGTNFTTDDVSYAQEGRTGYPRDSDLLDDNFKLHRQSLIEKVRVKQHFPKLTSELKIEKFDKIDFKKN